MYKTIMIMIYIYIYIYPYLTRIPGGLSTRTPRLLYGWAQGLFAGSEFAYKPKPQQKRTKLQNVVTKASKMGATCLGVYWWKS